MKSLRTTILMLIVLRLGAQAPAPGSIRGSVVKWGSGEAVADVIVELRNPAETTGVPLMSTATRQNGEYTFPRVSPGRYRIIATRKGYAPGEYGRRRLSGAGEPVALAAGQAITNARIEIAAGASVSGRVSYANGEPMPIARVQISKLTYRNGRPELTPQQSTYTNDLGEYRLFWILPGSYYLSAENAQNNTTPSMLVNPEGNSTYSWSGVFGSPRATARITSEYGTEEGQTYIPIYYPGTSSWENASPIELRPGDTATNINLRLIPAVQRRVRGVVLDVDGRPVQETIVVSLRQLDSSLPSNLRSLQFFPDNGRFQFTVTVSGTYEVMSSLGPLSGRAVTTVRDREAEVSIRLFPATSLTGRVIMDSAASGLTVTLRGVRNIQNASVGANGEFTIQNLAASTYLVEVAMPNLPDAYVKSVRAKDADLPNEELLVEGYSPGEMQIVVGTGGSIAGRVLNAQQQPAANATVVALPEGLPAYRADRYRSATVDSSGVFLFRGLPPGQYNIYAWEDVDSGAWFNSAFLRNYDSYRRSIPVAEGQRATADIVAAPVAP